ncbi:MAG: hypothetical protein HUJ70_08720 [Pseudobutyrivibrio sp.]|nr:hypothetical protein [Pseudobutyrivibrio sp.]
MGISWWRQTITRIRPSVKEVRGSEIPDWDNATSLVIKNCSVQPSTTSLSEDGRVLGITEGLTAYIPPNSDVNALDRIMFEGSPYTIDGEPMKRQSASGRNDFIQLQLKRWEG